MKKVIFLAIAFFAFSFGYAQDISFGAKAGLNLATMNSSVSEINDALDSRVAFHVGAVAEFSFSDTFSVQPELLYNSVGASVTVDSEEGGGDYIIDYLSIPVLAKYYVADGFSLQAGPQIGFLLAAKAKPDSGEEEDIKDMYESTDFGLGFGAGYKMESGLFFDARYVLGLSNTWKDTGDETMKNNAFQFSVGYMFN